MLTSVLLDLQRIETMEVALAGTEAEQTQAVHLMTRKIERAWAAKLRVLKVSLMHCWAWRTFELRD